MKGLEIRNEESHAYPMLHPVATVVTRANGDDAAPIQLLDFCGSITHVLCRSHRRRYQQTVESSTISQMRQGGYFKTLSAVTKNDVGLGPVVLSATGLGTVH